MEVERRQNISFWIATELLAEEGCIVETANDGIGKKLRLFQTLRSDY